MASFLGIDLSKETFHACLLSDGPEAKKGFPNTPEGFEQLMSWLKNRRAADVHVCMEATGSYGEALHRTSWPRATRERRQPGPHQDARTERVAMGVLSSLIRKRFGHLS